MNKLQRRLSYCMVARRFIVLDLVRALEVSGRSPPAWKSSAREEAGAVADLIDMTDVTIPQVANTPSCTEQAAVAVTSSRQQSQKMQFEAP